MAELKLQNDDPSPVLETDIEPELLFMEQVLQWTHLAGCSCRQHPRETSLEVPENVRPVRAGA